MSGILLTVAIGIMSVVFGIALSAVIKEKEDLKVMDRSIIK